MSPRPVRALVVGASGFLGSRLLALAPHDVGLVGTSAHRPVRPGNWRDVHLDLSAPSSVREVVQRERPSAVFYCAYDKSDPTITVDGAVAAARASYTSGARFVLFSSDLVFDGLTGGYTENAITSPISPYGEMKAEAEALVRAEHPGALVIRTSLLVGESGTTLRPAYECESLVRGQSITLYRDEWRSPTLADDVARASWELCALEVSGVFHVAGERLTRVELGHVVCDLYRFDRALIREVDRPPSRPRDTSLDSRRVAALLGWAPRALSQLAHPPARARA